MKSIEKYAKVLGVSIALVLVAIQLYIQFSSTPGTFVWGSVQTIFLVLNAAVVIYFVSLKNKQVRLN